MYDIMHPGLIRNLLCDGKRTLHKELTRKAVVELLEVNVVTVGEPYTTMQYNLCTDIESVVWLAVLLYYQDGTLDKDVLTETIQRISGWQYAQSYVLALEVHNTLFIGHV